ncbi:MAG: hypothetical protein ACJ8LG_15860 [Massilia sp.]
MFTMLHSSAVQVVECLARQVQLSMQVKSYVFRPSHLPSLDVNVVGCPLDVSYKGCASGVIEIAVGLNRLVHDFKSKLEPACAAFSIPFSKCTPKIGARLSPNWHDDREETRCRMPNRRRDRARNLSRPSTVANYPDRFLPEAAIRSISYVLLTNHFRGSMSYQVLLCVNKMTNALQLPSRAAILAGSKEFQRQLPREVVYKTATFLVSHYWGNQREVADGLGILLLTWNQAFYRYGAFSFEALESCIRRNNQKLDEFRTRTIADFDDRDAPRVKKIFKEFLDCLAIENGAKAGVSSPVAAAKALHVLAPHFFPLWDNKIARAYNCYYAQNPADKYLKFLRVTKEMAASLLLQPKQNGRSALKIVDEYNFARFTRNWVRC